MKERYLSLMEKALSAYSDEHINEYFNRVKNDGLTEHGFARLTSNIGILLAHGIRTDLRPIFTEMMDFCTQTMPHVKAANDFSIREILFCLMELEEEKAFDADTVTRWKNCFRTLDREACYNVFSRKEEDDPRNWAFFTLVSEWMRKVNGLEDTEEFIEFQLIGQMRRFDENGQYHDHPTNRTPHQPFVYDLVPRTLTAMLLHFGYRGRYYEELLSLIKTVTPLTLASQSVNGELPFGGRSNQFIHNEAMLVTFLEFMAGVYYDEGDLAMAKRCKAAIRLAVENMEYWFAKKPIHHVKNRFPLETRFGCENYAYFDKYMITAASNLYPAYRMCREDIADDAEPDSAPNVVRTSEYFHKLFLRAGGYFAEFDTNADPHYDCCGLGRVHRKGAPPQIAISVPCPAASNYTVCVENPINLSICPGIIIEDEPVFATAVGHEIVRASASDSSAFACLSTEMEDMALLSEYTLDESGVSICVRGEGEVALMLPSLTTDGENTAEVHAVDNVLEIRYDGWICRYTADAPITDLGRDAGNRNGIYHAWYVSSQDEVNVTLEILPIE